MGDALELLRRAGKSTVFFAGAGRVKPELPRRRAKVHVFLRKSGKTRERRAKVHVFPRQKREIVEIAKFTFTIAGLLPILAKNALKTCTFAGLFAGTGRVKPELPRRRAKVHVFLRKSGKTRERRAKVHVFLRISGKTRERRAKVHVFPRQKRENRRNRKIYLHNCWSFADFS
ncbi:Uncharacterised protein [Chlamydia abortus]|nr:Uncharacterised protein [Chlamydia abortus]